jgi:hypothetical protein
MGREKVTRRQKDLSRLLREKKRLQRDRFVKRKKKA